MVYSYWGLTTDVIARAFWHNSTASTPTYYQRLKLLCTHRYLAARQISSFSVHGTSRLFFTVGTRGAAIVAHFLKLGRAELRRASRISAPANIVHHAHASHFRLSVDRAAELLPHVAVDEWQSEWELAKTPVVATIRSRAGYQADQVITNIADRAFTMSLPDARTYSFLVEIDRATMTRARIKDRLRGYLLHARAAPQAARAILWVVPDQQRTDALSAWAREEAAALECSPTIFAIAPRHTITEHTVLQRPIWQVPTLSAPQTLLPAEILATSSVGQAHQRALQGSGERSRR
jgi:hypothetical protein